MQHHTLDDINAQIKIKISDPSISTAGMIITVKFLVPSYLGEFLLPKASCSPSPPNHQKLICHHALVEDVVGPFFIDFCIFPALPQTFN
jgi:hypothetical protein